MTDIFLIESNETIKTYFSVGLILQLKLFKKFHNPFHFEYLSQRNDLHLVEEDYKYDQH